MDGWNLLASHVNRYVDVQPGKEAESSDRP